MLLPQYCGEVRRKSLFYEVYIRHCKVPLQVLDTLLREWRKDRTNKVLISTKFIKLLAIWSFISTPIVCTALVSYRSSTHLLLGYGFLKLDGSTKQSDSKIRPSIAVVANTGFRDAYDRYISPGLGHLYISHLYSC
jgi:hypothetical protein